MKLRKIAVPVSIAMLSVMMFGCGTKKDNDSDVTKNTKVEQKSDDAKKSSEKKDDKASKESDSDSTTNNQNESENRPEESNTEEAASSVLPAEINQEEVKGSIIAGKQVLFEIFTSRDPEKVDQDSGRTGVVEKFNTAVKMKAELSPYFSDRYIEDFMTNIIQAKEENGELTMVLGDLGMWGEYPQMEVKNTSEEGGRLIVEYMAPSGVGDINHRAEMLYLDGQWKMDKESNN